jgi:hypothetical protein
MVISPKPIAGMDGPSFPSLRRGTDFVDILIRVKELDQGSQNKESAKSLTQLCYERGYETGKGARNLYAFLMREAPVLSVSAI